MKSAVHLAGALLLFCAAATLAQSPLAQATAQQDDKKAVENVVRTFDQAVQEYDFVKANSLFTPDARWIEESYPQPIAGGGEGKWFEDAKAAKVKIVYHFRSLEAHVNGDVAWVTDILDAVFQADTDAGRALIGGKSEWHPVFVESEVLLKTPNGWKIVLGHTTRMPESK
jgi:ketosteroid isomerase-like protein